MDEADARARVNSQISRDDRLATASHVVDNGGDRDSLIEQVDALWVELNELSPDSSPDSSPEE
jgi:dephospho-CoA kinase